MERLSKFLRLSREEKSLLIQAIILLATTRGGLRVLPFVTLRNLLTRLTRRRGGTEHRFGGAGPDRTVWAVQTASRHFPAIGTCLTQALAMHVLLARKGSQSQLRIGVMRNSDGKFVAHAWLEKDGVIVIGAAGHKSYTPMPVLNGLEP